MCITEKDRERDCVRRLREFCDIERNLEEKCRLIQLGSSLDMIIIAILAVRFDNKDTSASISVSLFGLFCRKGSTRIRFLLY